MVQTSYITILSMVGLGLRVPPGGGKKFVCLAIILLNGRTCANDYAIKAFEHGNAFDTIGQERVCSHAPAFNFVSALHR